MRGWFGGGRGCVVWRFEVGSSWGSVNRCLRVDVDNLAAGRRSRSFGLNVVWSEWRIKESPITNDAGSRIAGSE